MGKRLGLQTITGLSRDEMKTITGGVEDEGFACENWKDATCCTNTMAACGSRNDFKCTPGGTCC